MICLIKTVSFTRPIFKIHSELVGWHRLKVGNLTKRYVGAFFYPPLMLVLALAPSAQAAEAILVNGGGSAVGNRCDFFRDIDRADRVLDAWGRVRLSADGNVPNGPPNSEKCDSSGNTIKDPSHRPILTRQTPQSGVDGAARFAELRTQVLKSAASLKPGDPLLLYFTDHGGNSSSKAKDHSIALWNETLTSTQMHDLLAEVREALKKNPATANNKVVLIHDHCFGGGMIEEELWQRPPAKDTTTPIENTCGFSPASGSEYAYDGESFMKMSDQILKSRSSKLKGSVDRDHSGDISFGEVKRYMERSYSTQSVPTSSSDLFLAKYLDAHDIHSEKNRRELLDGCALDKSKSKQLLNSLGAIQDSSRVLLETKLKSVREDLGQYYIGAGISPSTSMAQIEKLHKQRQENLRNAQNALADAQKAVSPALYAFTLKQMKSELSDRAIDLVEKALQISRALIEKLDRDDITGTEKKEIEAELQKIRETPVDTLKGHLKQTEIRTEMRRRFSASINTAAFKQFPQNPPINSDGKPAWPADCLAKHNTATKIESTALGKTHSLSRLVGAVRQAEALNQIGQDPEALNTYLKLLECENVTIGGQS